MTYADGQYTDVTTFMLPQGVDEVDVKLWYQTASRECLDFLEANATGLTLDLVVGSSVIWGQVVGDPRDTHDLERGEQLAFAGTNVPGLAIDKQISPSSNLLPGQPLSITIPFTNTDIFPIGNVSIADLLPSTIVNATVQTILTGGTINIIVTTDKVNPLAPATFVVSTVNASAQAGGDYVAVNNAAFAIAPGASSATFALQIVNDDSAENDESFQIVFTGTSDAALGATQIASIVIKNEDEGAVTFNENLFLPTASR